MGFASRKRGNSGGKKGSKDRYGSDDGISKPSNRRGGSRNRVGSRSRGNSDAIPAPQQEIGGIDENGHLRRRKVADLTLLTRGMSARMVGSRIASHIKILAADESAKDLRHMEAYATACTTYAQQFFAYTNQELVVRGVYGPAPPIPGAPGYASNGPGSPYGTSAGYDPAAGQYSPAHAYQRTADGRMVPAGSPISGAMHMQGHPISMPVKIDPEEEKRQAQLKKKMALTEVKREKLEGEYESLKSHFVYASKVCQKTKLSVTGQLDLLKELVKRRSVVAALRRVRCAVARDILVCLEARASGVKIGTKKVASEDRGKENNSGAEAGAGDKEDEKKENDGEKKPELKDLVDCWNWIDMQLVAAEKDCTVVSSPENLLSLKKMLAGQVDGKDADENATVAADVTSGGHRSKSKSKAKSKTTVKSEESSSDGAGPKTEANLYLDNDGIVPWMSQTLPRTPRGVPIYLSYLSSAPGSAGGFGTGGTFGNDQDSLAWLEQNIPLAFEPEYAKDREELHGVREEVHFLVEELECERDNNKQLQSEIIANRTRSDEMCSMMSILRTETEAVLNRHNMLLETKEAQEKATAVHKSYLKALEDERVAKKNEVGASSNGDAGAGDVENGGTGDVEVNGEAAGDGEGDASDGAGPSSIKRGVNGAEADSPSNGGALKRRRRL